MTWHDILHPLRAWQRHLDQRAATAADMILAYLRLHPEITETSGYPIAKALGLNGGDAIAGLWKLETKGLLVSRWEERPDRRPRKWYRLA